MSGASVLVSGRGKPETLNGIRTRGSQRTDDSKGRGAHMEQERGAFKVKPADADLRAKFDGPETLIG